MSIYIHPTAVLGPNVTVEEGVYIGPLCIIGYPAEYKGKEDLDKGVIIGKGTRITGLVTIDSGTEGPTRIGQGCYLMKHSHVGHDAVIGDGVTISCGAKIGGHAFIGAGSNVGLNAVVHQHKSISEGCMIGAMAMVTKKLQTEPYKTYAGVPAKLIGENDKHPNYTIYQQQMYGENNDLHAGVSATGANGQGDQMP